MDRAFLWLDDLREGIVKLKQCGGDLTAEPNDTEEDPLHLAMCVDTEGNEFMMTMSESEFWRKWSGNTGGMSLLFPRWGFIFIASHAWNVRIGEVSIGKIS